MSKLNVSFLRIHVIAPCYACFNDIYVIWIDNASQGISEEANTLRNGNTGMSHIKYPSICIYIFLFVQMDTQTISNTHTNQTAVFQ